MCGFTGYFDPSSEQSHLLIKQMTNQLHSRGPDSLGVFTDNSIGISIGHRRLSILDLSDNGSQPMYSRSKRLIIAYNGEIYNHLSIRKRIESIDNSITWKGHSDTETIVNSVEIIGFERTLELLNGMFAFTILDTHTKKLYLARDRFGEKPLYYGIINKVLFFGSQPKSFKPHPKFQPSISKIGLNDYFLRGYIASPYSIYNDIYKLDHSSYLIIDLKTMNISSPITYWQINNTNRLKSNPNEIETELDYRINESVKLRSLSDVPVGCFLSGGIDSSLISYYLQKNSIVPIKTFTIGFENNLFDESKYASLIANYLGTNHNCQIFTNKECVELIEKMPSVWDEPFADSSQLPTLLLSQFASLSTKVVLSGDAGDELFCGYTRYNIGYKIYKNFKYIPYNFISILNHLFTCLSNESSSKYLSMIPIKYRPPLFIDRFSKLLKILKTSDVTDFYSSLTSLFPVNAKLFKNESLFPLKPSAILSEFDDFREYMMSRDLNEYLPYDILTKVDRASMSCGLEARVPFLDHELANWANNIPTEIKTLDGAGKWPLRKLLASKMPKELFDRPKMGFGIPLNDLLSKSLKPLVYQYLSKGIIKEQGIFNEKLISNILESHYSKRKRNHNQIWTLLMFQMWFYENF